MELALPRSVWGKETVGTVRVGLDMRRKKSEYWTVPQLPLAPWPSPRQSPSRLVGIARLAAESPSLAAKTEVEYRALPVRSILNRCESKRVPFDYTINPYRGCEFGCKYCYARYTHEYMELDGALFENRIYAKQRAAERLQAELKKAEGAEVAIGTATDPYQPAERRFEVTRQILEVIAARARGVRLSITTKSDLVVRDLELLREIARRNSLHVNMTITTLHAPLARALEPRAPRPDLRLSAVRRLAEGGVWVGVFAAPVLPAITDKPKDLEAVARAAAAAGARHFMAAPLFLMPSAQRQFFPFLETEFPHLLGAYRRSYQRGAYLGDPYRQRLQGLVNRLREKYGLLPSPRAYPVEAPQVPIQAVLFDPEARCDGLAAGRVL